MNFPAITIAAKATTAIAEIQYCFDLMLDLLQDLSGISDLDPLLAWMICLSCHRHNKICH